MEYAQARMQARRGAAPGEALWRRLGVHEGLAAYLAAARATVLGGWVAGIGDRADAHQIELALRDDWREAVLELVRWMPGEWQSAVGWTATLVDLPALAWLRAGASPQRWMEDDPILAAHLADGDLAPLGGRNHWLQEWRALWPGASDEESQALEQMVAAIENRLGARANRFAGSNLHAGLEQDAARWFRRFAARPPAAFAYLILVALDLGRLRTALVLRALGLESVA